MKDTVEKTNREFFGGHWNADVIGYLSRSAGARWFNHLFALIVEEIDPRRVLSIADIGCGVGVKTAMMASRFPAARVVGFDFTASAIDVASKVHRLENLSFSMEDITAIGSERRYDLITSFDVLEHVRDWKGLVDNLIKVNDRYLFFSLPVGRMRPFEVHVGHFRNFKRNEMERFLALRGYRTVKTFYAGCPFFSPILRDLTNVFFKKYVKESHARMTPFKGLFHDIWYFLFRYCSSRQTGDNFLGLFEKR